MILASKKVENLHGEIELPPSKSHTIRGLTIALLAEGKSIIKNPLLHGDCESALNAIILMGARVKKKNKSIVVKGTGGNINPGKIYVGNSGTTLRIMTGVAGLQEGEFILDGDSSIRKRPMQPLIDSLNELGAKAESRKGCAPIKVRGRIAGGRTRITGESSQYLTSLLLSTPLAGQRTVISVSRLNEIPYVEMTLSWLDEQGIKYRRKGMNEFIVEGNQRYKNFRKAIPADWSASAFPICAAAAVKSKVVLKGLSIKDTQGDKRIIGFIEDMGGHISVRDREIAVDIKQLRGIDVDLNAYPDMLPALAVIGCFASGETVIRNVPQARIKECDRIKAMCSELRKMGAVVRELKDGLEINQSMLKGAAVNGYNDHRVIMALACAGMGAEGETVIKNARNIDVSFPAFVEKMNAMGAKIKLKNES
ncbi:3-phosphoshikimate 1-carboxyvinyltransferase [Candidatus Woesearchaeota archaeon]|nr:3-phosphoshikimate 1-carboxyvinyltransferase [Candidatus Woesearchaeota archaeon]